MSRFYGEIQQFEKILCYVRVGFFNTIIDKRVMETSNSSQQKTRRCLYCGGDLTGMHPLRTTCNNSCRLAYFKDKNNVITKRIGEKTVNVRVSREEFLEWQKSHPKTGQHWSKNNEQ